MKYKLYNDFINSLEEKRDYPIMMHLPSNVAIAIRFFENYLTEDELQERQYRGRFWDICKISCPSGFFMYYLYILVDNETLVIVDNEGRTQILGRDRLPYSLQGRYYDEC